MTTDVIIPTYKPDRRLRRLLQMLQLQTERPRQILLINTEKELFDTELLDGLDSVRITHIRKLDFDHGGTRNQAASMLSGDLILFMTQDAVPEDENLIERLMRPFDDSRVCAAYARQLPAKGCSPIERFTRNFNYPAQSRIKTAEDLPTLQVKTFFCSNVCALYRRSTFEELGGFENHTIFNEDMIFAAKLIMAQKAVAYCADARVVHSHNYNGREQFHRNFDIGVSQEEHPEIFSGVSSEGEGIRMVKDCAAYLLREKKPGLLPVLVWQSGCKFLGYSLGKSFRRLPPGLVRACSMNKEYWE